MSRFIFRFINSPFCNDAFSQVSFENNGRPQSGRALFFVANFLIAYKAFSASVLTTMVKSTARGQGA